METFRTDELAGWVRRSESGREVLLLHGGPGLSHDYLLPLVETLPNWSVASFQQRGLAPSTTDGPFDVPTAVADVAKVLDELGWERPLIAGHSWGGLLAWHVAVALGDRLGGVLAIDSMGAVGDMGMPQFIAELRRRLTPESAAQLARWDALEEERPLTEVEELAALELLWPSYFADPAQAPPFVPIALSVPANTILMASAIEHQAAVIEGLPRIRIPSGALVGSGSPIPKSASFGAMDLVPGSWVEVLEGAGHFVWHEQPGAVATALDRLLG